MNFHFKTIRSKARWVCDGSTQPGDASSFYSPTPSRYGLHSTLSSMAKSAYPIRKLDVQAAFLYADLDPCEYVMVKSPPGVIFPDSDLPKNRATLLVTKSLFGLRQAPKRWWQLFDSHLSRVGELQHTSYSQRRLSLRDKTTYAFKDGTFLVVHVDDALYSGPSASRLEQ